MILEGRKHELLLIIFAAIVIILSMVYPIFNYPVFNELDLPEYVPSSSISVAQEDKINLNTADADELSQLIGVGKVKAEAIIKYRENNGLFRSVEEFKDVDGISQSIYDANIDKICV